MSPRIVALTAIAAAVAGLGVYLLVEVQSGPAKADAVTPGGSASRATGSAAAVATNRPTLAPDRPARAGVTATAPIAGDDDLGSGSGSGSDAAAGSGSAAAKPTPKHLGGPHLFRAPGHDPSRADKIDHMLDESAHAYDAGNYDRAKAIASQITKRQPDNARANGILAAAACAQNDAAAAQGYYAKLPADARASVKASCSGISLQEPQ